MIVFDLKCDAGHVFEGWFASSTAFEDQCKRQLIQCPVCHDVRVRKAVMAPNIAAKGNKATTTPGNDAQSLFHALATAQAKLLQSS